MGKETQLVPTDGKKNVKKKELQRKEPKQSIPTLGTEKANRLIQEIVEAFTEKVDYGTIPGCKKPSLFKPGAEKPCLAFNLEPRFERDVEMYTMLPGVQNLIAFKCILIDRRTGERVGEGRGSTILGSRANCSDPNSATKMAEKSAQIDAVLRTFALSGRFTQDVEDMNLNINVRDQNGKKSRIEIDHATGGVTEVSL